MRATLESSPIFVLGNRRSGTTMLRLMLTSHPGISIPPEGGFIVQLGWKYGRAHFSNRRQIQYFIEDLFSLGNTQDWDFDRQSLLDHLEHQIPLSYPGLVDTVYRYYGHKKYSGKRRWGDKSTGLYMEEYIQMVDRFFPNAKYIHIIRDCPAVIASYHQVPHLKMNSAGQIAMEWQWNIRNWRRFGENIGDKRYYEIRYENLVSAPDNELKKICAFLDEPYSGEMLSFYKLNQELQLEPERHLGWKGKTLENVTNQRVAAWRNELKTSERAISEFITKHVLASTPQNDTEAISLPLLVRCSLMIQNLCYTISRNLKMLLRPIKYLL